MKRIGLVACAAFLSASVFSQQNVGIGTNNPQTKLQVEGAISVAPAAAAAAANVTIPDNVSIFRLSLSAGGGTTNLTLASPKEGQYLTIYNQDDNAATFEGQSIAPLTGVISVNYINAAWRLVSDNQPKNLSLTGNQLSISGGNSVTFTNWDTDGTDDITTATNAAGDVTGPFSNLQLGASVVTATELANNAVTSAKIANSTIATADMANNAIDSTKLGIGVTTGDMLIYNGTDWQRLPAGAANEVLKSNGAATLPTWQPDGSGVGTVTGVSGTAPIQSSGGTTPVISITQATTASNGYLSSADWNTFNNKLSTEVDGVIGNEVTDITPLGGLVRAGAGTAVSPYTLGIATGGVTTTHILDGTIATADVANNAIDGTKINISGNAIGDIIYYNGTDWVRLPAGTSGQVLKANGAAAPAWGTDNAGTGTVTSVATGAGLTGGPITNTGTVSLANGTAAGQVFVTGATPFTPALATMGGDATIASNGTLTLTNNSVNTAEITNNAVDGTKINIASNAAGDMMYYNGTDWVRIPAGTANQVLHSNGTAAPTWGTDDVGTGTVTGVTATAPVVSSGGTAPVISMAAASASVNGYLTSTDWTTFNSKLSAEVDGIIGNEVTNATASGGLVRAGSGTAAAPYTLGIASNGVITSHILNNAVDGTKINLSGNAIGDIMYYNGTDWVRLAPGTAGQVLHTNGSAAPTWATDDVGTGTVTGVTATSPVVSSGGTAPVISMAAASASVNGYLTSTDWTTFNNKLSAEVDGIIGNEVTNATASGGLVRAGSGTAAAPYTLGIASNGVVSAHIAPNTIVAADINSMGATSGQVLTYNGSAWAPATPSGGGGSGNVLVGVRVFSSGSGTYTPTAGTTSILVKLVGGGGGGGGTNWNACSGQFHTGSGGGGGGYCETVLNPVGASYAYSVGAGGGAGSVNSSCVATNGGTGGTTTFGSLTATGGAGGTTAVSTGYAAGGNGGTGTGGTIIRSGSPGGTSVGVNPGCNGGAGGASFMGSGAPDIAGYFNGTYTIYLNGLAATQPGGGGGGSIACGAGTSTGGAGAAGIIMIYEYK